MFELTTCAMVDRRGRDCLAPRADWSQLPMCQAHLREAYIAFAERLQYLKENTAEDLEDVERMVIPPGRLVDDRECVVYYIRIGHFVKIGTTVSMATRMSSLQPDEVLAIELGSFELEAQRHQQFAHIRAPKGREYFWPTDELLAHAADVRARWVEPAARPPEPKPGHQAGLICPACDMKNVCRKQAHGPAVCGSCGHTLTDTDAPA